MRYHLPMTKMGGATVIGLTALIASGCLGNSYTIPKRDLAALSQIEPARRGDQVRVIQRFSTSDHPPEATPVHASTNIVIVGGSGSRRRSGVSAGAGGIASKSSKAAKGAAEDSKFWIVLAAVAAVGLAATEGARFDGWARLHPMHPVHLFGPYGEYAAVPLAHIDPETAAWARRAIVVESEGPWQPLARAPLNRIGFTYSVLMGAAEQPSADDSEGNGFMSHIQFGFFPSQTTGIQLDIGLGFRDNAAEETIFDGRYALELDYIPVELGKLHLGVFGQVGIGVRLEDGIQGGDRRGMLYGGGALAQLELTTRLALTARLQATRFYDTTVSDFGLGLSIY